jgi:hypothetical protein
MSRGLLAVACTLAVQGRRRPRNLVAARGCCHQQLPMSSQNHVPKQLKELDTATLQAGPPCSTATLATKPASVYAPGDSQQAGFDVRGQPGQATWVLLRRLQQVWKLPAQHC